jgi:cytochrome c
MKWQQITAVTLSAFVFAAPVAQAAEEFGNAKEAEAMLAKAKKHVQTAGAEKAYADFTAKAPAFIDRDLYPVVYDMSGKVLAHGQNPKQVGKDLLEFQDADGKEFIKERVTLAKTKTTFSQDYKFTDPLTKKVLPKSTFCEKVAEVIVCVGYYKR